MYCIVLYCIVLYCSRQLPAPYKRLIDLLMQNERMSGQPTFSPTAAKISALYRKGLELSPVEQTVGAPYNGFLVKTLKTLLRQSRVLLDL